MGRAGSCSAPCGDVPRRSVRPGARPREPRAQNTPRLTGPRASAWKNASVPAAPRVPAGLSRHCGPLLPLPGVSPCSRPVAGVRRGRTGSEAARGLVTGARTRSCGACLPALTGHPSRRQRAVSGAGRRQWGSAVSRPCASVPGSAGRRRPHRRRVPSPASAPRRPGWGPGRRGRGGTPGQPPDSGARGVPHAPNAGTFALRNQGLTDKPWVSRFLATCWYID